MGTKLKADTLLGINPRFSCSNRRDLFLSLPSESFGVTCRRTTQDGTSGMLVLEDSCLKYRFLGSPGLSLDLQGLGPGLFLETSDGPLCVVSFGNGDLTELHNLQMSPTLRPNPARHPAWPPSQHQGKQIQGQNLGPLTSKPALLAPFIQGRSQALELKGLCCKNGGMEGMPRPGGHCPSPCVIAVPCRDSMCCLSFPRDCVF